MMFSEQIHFKYGDGAWVKERGFPEHHLRIIFAFFDDEGERWYQVFDTTLKRGYADYEWRRADQLEANSDLVANAQDNQHLWFIGARCAAVQHVKYSLPARTDCESLQRFVQTGQEADRWCPQLWKMLAGCAAVGVLVAVANNRKRR
jgi:hypothetical protein